MLVPMQQHDPQIECPNCHLHTVVRHSESEYVCINCNFRRDLSQPHVPPLINLFLLAVLGLVVVVLIG